MGQTAQAAPLLRVKKLKRTDYAAAIPHNLPHRLPHQPTPAGADPARTQQNVVLSGPETPEGVEQLAVDLIASAGVCVPKRRDAVAAHEVLFSAPPEMANARDYLAACVTMLTHYTGAPCLSAVMHVDQGAPHCHVLLLPLVVGRWRGGDLFRRADLAQLHAAHRAVAARFGLRAAAPLAGNKKAQAVAAVLDRMRDSPARDCITWPAVRAAIEADPAPFMLRLGIECPAKTVRPPRSFTAIMTGAGKRTSEDRAGINKGPARVEANPIGFEPPEPDTGLGFEPPRQPEPKPIRFAPPNPIGFDGSPASLTAPADDWRNRPPEHAQTPEQIARWLRNRRERERRKRKQARTCEPVSRRVVDQV